MEPLGLRSWAYAELGVQGLPAGVELAHGLPPESLPQIGADEKLMGAFVGGVLVQGSSGDRRRLLGRALFEECLGERDAQPLGHHGQLLASGLGPGGVPVLGQQLTGERVERGAELRGNTRFERFVCQAFRVVRVDPHRVRIEPQQRPVGGEVRRRGARREFRFQGAACGVQGDAQAAERGGRVGVGPADVHGLLAVEAVAR